MLETPGGNNSFQAQYINTRVLGHLVAEVAQCSVLLLFYDSSVNVDCLHGGVAANRSFDGFA